MFLVAAVRNVANCDRVGTGQHSATDVTPRRKRECQYQETAKQGTEAAQLEAGRAVLRRLLCRGRFFKRQHYRGSDYSRRRLVPCGPRMNRAGLDGEDFGVMGYDARLDRLLRVGRACLEWRISRRSTFGRYAEPPPWLHAGVARGLDRADKMAA